MWRTLVLTVAPGRVGVCWSAQTLALWLASARSTFFYHNFHIWFSCGKPRKNKLQKVIPPIIHLKEPAGPKNQLVSDHVTTPDNCTAQHWLPSILVLVGIWGHFLTEPLCDSFWHGWVKGDCLRAVFHVSERADSMGRPAFGPKQRGKIGNRWS